MEQRVVLLLGGMVLHRVAVGGVADRDLGSAIMESIDTLTAINYPRVRSSAISAGLSRVWAFLSLGALKYGSS